jgi:hypothetical protein
MGGQKDMRFMIITKATRDSEAGVMPSDAVMAEMASFFEGMAKAGVLLDAAGLYPSSNGVRIRCADGTRTVTDGPFAETKEIIGGYTIIQVKTREEALEWARRFPLSGDAQIELRQMVDLEDLEANDTIDRFKKLEEEART